ncbi:hypothetical protein [Desulfovibrio piger]
MTATWLSCSAMEKNFSFFLFSLQKDILVSSVCFQNKAAIFSLCPDHDHITQRNSRQA